jgi:hypothetical protein
MKCGSAVEAASTVFEIFEFERRIEFGFERRGENNTLRDHNPSASGVK